MTAGADRSPSWDIDEVLARTDLARLLDEVAQPGTSATRGRRWHCPVPDHDDIHASVTMHTDHRGHERWRCWSGDDGHRGDALDLVAITQKFSRRAAVDWLAQRAGLVPDHPLPPRPRRRAGPPVPKHVPLNPAVVRYAARCERMLWEPEGRDVLAWLHHRGFTDDVLRVNHVGADPGMDRMWRGGGLPRGVSEAAVFPPLDPGGTVAYVQARYLEPAGGMKYDNPAGYLGSNPRLAWAQTTSSPAPGLLLVCEGVPDALTAAQAGYAAVAILGHQAPDEHAAARIASHATEHHQSITAIIDADDAGHIWGRHLADMLAAHGHDLTLLEPPSPGLDLNAWARQDHGWHSTLSSLEPPAIEL